MATLADGPPAAFSGSVLEAYYRQCQPASAAEVLGLPEDQAPGLSGLHAHAYTMPWWAGRPDLQKRALWRKREAAQYGYQLSITDGNKNYGPVSLENGELEILRLTRLYQSMSLHGYQRHDGVDGDVKGMLLTDAGGNWCVSTRSGQHRVAVAAALGLESIPVRINHAPVKREELLYWPQVAEGRISPDGALVVFDRTMRGDPPPACDFRSDAPAAPVTKSSSPA
ncbi:hypothetical protein [Aquisalimonas sp.]|uniref:hypothetical protein n=1 Tax=Aquisalimonas sp. TaxID=1872621 RepID=UPI0025C39C92|nr:hypothetical protein [Aquisalimonas sp.]